MVLRALFHRTDRRNTDCNGQARSYRHNDRTRRQTIGGFRRYRIWRSTADWETIEKLFSLTQASPGVAAFDEGEIATYRYPFLTRLTPAAFTIPSPDIVLAPRALSTVRANGQILSIIGAVRYHVRRSSSTEIAPGHRACFAEALLRLVLRGAGGEAVFACVGAVGTLPSKMRPEDSRRARIDSGLTLISG